MFDYLKAFGSFLVTSSFANKNIPMRGEILKIWGEMATLWNYAYIYLCRYAHAAGIQGRKEGKQATRKKSNAFYFLKYVGK